MNKLDGFYELNRIGLPSVPWKKYDRGMSLDEDILWTIRCAVLSGDDLNLPRKIGVKADEAMIFADNLINKMKGLGFVLYYPYFIAEKSGVIEVSSSKIVIEAVKKDLWNLVSLHDRDVTVIVKENELTINGDEKFLDEAELAELIEYSNKVKKQFRDLMIVGKSIFLEWSYSFNSDINKNPVGSRRLVFFEIRSV